MAQARLADIKQYHPPHIKNMPPDRVVYVVPWAMYASSDGLLWLDPDIEIKHSRFGTQSMKIELRDDGFHVWPVRGHNYQPLGNAPAGAIPVAVIEQGGGDTS